MATMTPVPPPPAPLYPGPSVYPSPGSYPADLSGAGPVMVPAARSTATMRGA